MPGLTPEFEAPLGACLFCGSNNIARFDMDYTGITIDRCPECGVKFMNPQYTDEHLARFYAEYNANLLDRGLNPERVREDKRIEYYSKYFGFIEQYIPRGRMLGVGCGDGLEMVTARERGWDVEGLDVDPEDTARVSEATGLTIRCGEFAKMDYASESFDCVYMHHVIEHPKNPADYIRKVREVLRPGGIYFLSTPNIGSLSGCYKTLAGKLGLKKRRGKHYDTWHHLFYYTPGVMKGILEDRFGFEVKYYRSGAEYRPKRSKLARHMILHHDILPFKSTFMMIAQKPE